MPGDCLQGVEFIDFYRFQSPGLKFSYFNRLLPQKKFDFLNTLYTQKPQVEVTAFALMPNHFHFLVQQQKDTGITRFLRLFQDSYAKYLNLKTQRTGSVFQSMFKAVRVESEKQFVHITRYIHLNPLTSFLLNNIDELKQYPWTSYIDYISTPIHPFINPQPLIRYFGSTAKFQEFTVNQIGYQRHLAHIRHLLLE